MTDVLATLAVELARVHSLLEDLDTAPLRRPVRACPGWDVAAVVRHLGGVHRWATAIVATGSDGSVDADGEAARAPDGAHPAELRDWFADGARRLLTELAAAPADRPCWTLAGAGTVSFWVCRQALETAVHRVDIELALGARPDVETALAVDGLDELATVLVPRQVRLGRTAALAGRLTFIATDAARTWQLGGHDFPSATLSGPAAPLFLALWGRIDLDEAGIAATGDPALLAAALAPAALTP